jgi:hypothetical protein
MEHKVKNPNKPTDSTIFKNETGYELFVRDEEWFVSGADSADKAQALLDAHNPPAPTEPTITNKLASVGLSIDDLKAALGLGNN